MLAQQEKLQIGFPQIGGEGSPEKFVGFFVFRQRCAAYGGIERCTPPHIVEGMEYTRRLLQVILFLRHLIGGLEIRPQVEKQPAKIRIRLIQQQIAEQQRLVVHIVQSRLRVKIMDLAQMFRQLAHHFRKGQRNLFLLLLAQLAGEVQQIAAAFDLAEEIVQVHHGLGFLRQTGESIFQKPDARIEQSQTHIGQLAGNVVLSAAAGKMQGRPPVGDAQFAAHTVAQGVDLSDSALHGAKAQHGGNVLLHMVGPQFVRLPDAVLLPVLLFKGSVEGLTDQSCRIELKRKYNAGKTAFYQAVHALRLAFSCPLYQPRQELSKTVCIACNPC